MLTLAPTDVRETGEYLGSLLSRQTVSARPQVAGYVRRILVKPGDVVRNGDSLIEIDQRQETAALDSAEAQQRSAESALELAKQTLVRTEQLYKEGLVSAQELERAQAALEAADATRKSAESAVAQRRVQLQYYTVRAPFAGTVSDVLVRVGDAVNTGTVITSIAQADALEVSVAVPAERARTIDERTTVEILDGSGTPIVTTTVYYVAPQADPRTQLVDVKAAFPNTTGLRPSELVRTRLVFSTRKALQVPALAVARQSGQPFVFVVQEKDGRTTVGRRPVELGTLGDRSYVVLSGLQEGERIATSSLLALRDGTAVKPKQGGASPAASAGGR